MTDKLAHRKKKVSDVLEDIGFSSQEAVLIRLKAENLRMREALIDATKRSSYPWKEGGSYNSREYMNEGALEVSAAILDTLLMPETDRLARRLEALEKLVDAASDWCRETEEECNHNPEWQTLSGALNELKATEAE